MPSFEDTVTYAMDPGGVFGLGAKGPKPIYYGGSPEELAARRKAYEEGRAGGAAQADDGLARLGIAESYAKGNAAMGEDTYRYGRDLGQGAIVDQNKALGGLLALAQRRGPSVAEAQQAAGVAQLQRSMMGQAADVRGGNQAAAFRNAHAAGAEMGGRLLSQQAALRASEEDAAIRRELAVREAISNTYGARAGQGFGLLGTGLGASAQATQQLGGFAAEGARIGAGREGAYLGAAGGVDAAQLDAELGRERQRYAGQQAMTGAALGTAGTIVGSMYGGPVGGAAGGAAGQQVGGAVQPPAQAAYNYDPYSNPWRTVA